MFEMAKAGCSLQLIFADLNRFVVLMYNAIQIGDVVLTACICLLTYFNIDFIRVHTIRCEARPVHIK